MSMLPSPEGRIICYWGLLGLEPSLSCSPASNNICCSSLVADGTAVGSRKRTTKSAMAVVPLYHWGVLFSSLGGLLLLLTVNLYIRERRDQQLVRRLNISNNWRWSQQNVVNDLVMQELLRGSVLDLPSNVMKTEHCFAHTYTITWIHERAGKKTTWWSPESGWCGAPTALWSNPARSW